MLKFMHSSIDLTLIVLLLKEKKILKVLSQLIKVVSFNVPFIGS